jgi:hypothetical protein
MEFKVVYHYIIHNRLMSGFKKAKKDEIVIILWEEDMPFLLRKRAEEESLQFAEESCIARVGEWWSSRS